MAEIIKKRDTAEASKKRKGGDTLSKGKSKARRKEVAEDVADDYNRSELFYYNAEKKTMEVNVEDVNFDNFTFNHRLLNEAHWRTIAEGMLNTPAVPDVALLVPFRFGQNGQPVFPAEPNNHDRAYWRGCKFFIVSGAHSLRAQKSIISNSHIPSIIRNRHSQRTAQFINGNMKRSHIIKLSMEENLKHNHVLISPIHQQLERARMAWEELGRPFPRQKSTGQASSNWSAFENVTKSIISKQEVYYVTRLVHIEDDSLFKIIIDTLAAYYNGDLPNESGEPEKDPTPKERISFNMLRSVCSMKESDMRQLFQALKIGEVLFKKKMKNGPQKESISEAITRLKSYSTFKELLVNFSSSQDWFVGQSNNDIDKDFDKVCSILRPSRDDLHKMQVALEPVIKKKMVLNPTKTKKEEPVSYPLDFQAQVLRLVRPSSSGSIEKKHYAVYDIVDGGHDDDGQWLRDVMLNEFQVGLIIADVRYDQKPGKMINLFKKVPTRRGRMLIIFDIFDMPLMQKEIFSSATKENTRFGYFHVSDELPNMLRSMFALLSFDKDVDEDIKEASLCLVGDVRDVDTPPNNISKYFKSKKRNTSLDLPRSHILNILEDLYDEDRGTYVMEYCLNGTVLRECMLLGYPCFALVNEDGVCATLEKMICDFKELGYCNVQEQEDKGGSDEETNSEKDSDNTDSTRDSEQSASSSSEDETRSIMRKQKQLKKQLEPQSPQKEPLISAQRLEEPFIGAQGLKEPFTSAEPLIGAQGPDETSLSALLEEQNSQQARDVEPPATPLNSNSAPLLAPPILPLAFQAFANFPRPFALHSSPPSGALCLAERLMHSSNLGSSPLSLRKHSFQPVTPLTHQSQASEQHVPQHPPVEYHVPPHPPVDQSLPQVEQHVPPHPPIEQLVPPQPSVEQPLPPQAPVEQPLPPQPPVEQLVPPQPPVEQPLPPQPPVEQHVHPQPSVEQFPTEKLSSDQPHQVSVNQLVAGQGDSTKLSNNDFSQHLEGIPETQVMRVMLQPQSDISHESQPSEIDFRSEGSIINPVSTELETIPNKRGQKRRREKRHLNNVGTYMVTRSKTGNSKKKRYDID